MKVISIILSVLIISSNCVPQEENQGKSVLVSGNYKYHIHIPDQNYSLPKKLTEISGIEILNDSIIVCIQDEKGKIYFFNQELKSITSELKFSGKGDYEDLAIVDSLIFVLQSAGRIYYFPINAKESIEADFLDTPFHSRNDLEGITRFDKDNLLIACKEKADVENNGVEGRAVYKYSFIENRLDLDPYIHLENDAFEKQLKKFDLNPLKHMPFGPSGIAVHPHTGDIFIIGSVGNLIVVMDKSGSIIDMGTLKPSIFRQPEGICFDSKGNLYISSEGKGGDGYILRFDFQKME